MKNTLSHFAATLTTFACAMLTNITKAFVFFVPALVFLTPSSYAEPKVLDSIAAIVDNQIILQSSLDERIAAITNNAQRSNIALPDATTLQEQVLESQKKLELLTAQIAKAEQSFDPNWD